MSEISKSYNPEKIQNLNLSSSRSQYEFKEHTDYIVEELAELMEVFGVTKPIPPILDECSDVLGFTLSLIGKVGIDIHLNLSVPANFIKTDTLFREAIVDLKLTCNLLKNRPWKKQQYSVDMAEFSMRFNKAISSILILLIRAAGDINTLMYGYYIKLNKNYKRLNTNY